MQQELFEKLKLEEEENGTINNLTLNNFVQNNSMGSFDFIYYTQKYLAQKDKALVDMLLYYFPSNNIVDDNYWQYFNWQNNMMDSPSTKPNLTQLLALANKCPLTNGRVVYAARNMYNRLTKQDKHFVNNCSSNLSLARQQQKLQIVRNSIKELPKAVVYPNPNNGQFTIKLNFDEKDCCTLKIKDVFGKTVLENKLNTIINNINLNISKGVYFIHLINTKTGKVVTEKLIVQ